MTATSTRAHRTGPARPGANLARPGWPNSHWYAHVPYAEEEPGERESVPGGAQEGGRKSKKRRGWEKRERLGERETGGEGERRERERKRERKRERGRTEREKE